MKKLAKSVDEMMTAAPSSSFCSLNQWASPPYRTPAVQNASRARFFFLSRFLSFLIEAVGLPKQIEWWAPCVSLYGFRGKINNTFLFISFPHGHWRCASAVGTPRRPGYAKCSNSTR